MADGSLFNGILSNFEELNGTNHDIEQLKNIDGFLKCGICYEYFTTCVVTDCSHNFCSLCIRKYIQYKTECPVCFHQLYDSQLRANRIIDNLVQIFPDLKDRVIRQLRTLKTLKPNCVYISPTCKDDETPMKTSSSRKQNPKTPENNFIESTERKESTTPVAGSSQLTKELVQPNKVIIPKIFQSPLKKNSSNVEVVQKYVSCPVCKVDILERNINAHLDDCLNRDKDENRKEENHSPKRKHLPKFVYRLMSLNVLRSKVKEYGLNAQGDFEILKNRLQKYTVLYNAECDKMDPRPVQEIIRQLEREEKALSSQKLPKSFFNISREDVSKEELNEQYLKENKSCFSKLVSCVKQRIESENTKKDGDYERNTKENLVTYDCQPSTSKSSFINFTDQGSNAQDWIEIEEHNVKIEPLIEIAEENLDEKPIIDIQKKSEDEKENGKDDVNSNLLRKSRRKSKRNLFHMSKSNLDSDEDETILLTPRKTAGSSDEICSNHSDDTDFEDQSNSPVIKKANPRKRYKKEVRGKNLRKRKN